MKKSIQWTLTVLACAAAATAVQANVHQFNAQLTGMNEVPPTNASATGVATLFYDDQGTADLGDDSWDFALSVFDLSGPRSATTSTVPPPAARPGRFVSTSVTRCSSPSPPGARC